MYGVREMAIHFRRALHTVSCDAPTETLKRKVNQLQKIRKKKDPKKNGFFVEVPESKSFLDTATLPMYLMVVGTALFAKFLMMYDDKNSQEMIERKIKNAPPGQGTVRMLTREEWEEFREVRPRTPFESKLARPNARIRTGEPLQMIDIWLQYSIIERQLNDFANIYKIRQDIASKDLTDWTIDVLTDAVTRAEECVKRKPWLVLF